MKRHAEIAGAGFAGLTAACALAQRGWSVRVHERGEQLRTTGAGIYIYENGLRVLAAVGAYEQAVRGAPLVHTREVRDHRDRLISVHHWKDSRVFSIVRQTVIDALAAAARRAGAEIVTGSVAAGASAEGELVLAHGRKLKADLIIGADGSNSAVREAVGLLSKRQYLVDGATRLLIAKAPQERLPTSGVTTIEYWSGSRRLLYTPCSETEIYIALTMLDRDQVAKATPVRKDAWKASFPQLAPLIERFGEQGRYDRFDLIKLRRWSAGRVAIIGDAAHALPPNIGQGAGCAMMNALSLAVYLERNADLPAALEIWERNERPITEHTQRMSYLLGLPTTWPPFLRTLALAWTGRSKWLVAQRTKTALHRPTGTAP
ncbi:MAG TPA: NAD(P)/FAD-dependent oxidoreductase [Xanthobacteraceae bacterium]|nr:NAD(P)/FAD-dependent oxidoreductase [Xanthobacteraceae bacterium]